MRVCTQMLTIKSDNSICATDDITKFMIQMFAKMEKGYVVIKVHCHYGSDMKSATIRFADAPTIEYDDFNGGKSRISFRTGITTTSCGAYTIDTSDRNGVDLYYRDKKVVSYELLRNTVIAQVDMKCRIDEALLVAAIGFCSLMVNAMQHQSVNVFLASVIGSVREDCRKWRNASGKERKSISNKYSTKGVAEQ